MVRILCVNPNAAIDKTVVVDRFRLNQIHRPQQVLALAGGKGCNVARALHKLGETPLVLGWVGGHAGRFIEDELRNEGIAADFVHTRSESRTCLSIIDETNHTITEIYEEGEVVTAASVETLYERFRAAIGESAAVTLSGSLPTGAPAALYALLIAMAHEAHVPVLLDSSGQPLREGAEAGPFLIKPNREEFITLHGAQPQNPDELTAAAQQVARRYATRVVISLGPDGVLATDGDGSWRVQAPPVAARSPVGSGDCLLAGLTYGLIHNFTFDEAARYGVAVGTANTLRLGAGNFTLADFERIRELVTVEVVG